MNETFRIIFLIYFITHIPITLFIDFQALFGSLYPRSLQSIIRWYTSIYHDFLMENPPTWFQSFIFAELVFQFPFFFYAIWALLNRDNTIRIPGIVYGVHVATTVLPILSEFFNSNKLSNSSRWILIGFYFPYFLIPFLFAFILIITPYPFGNPQRRQMKRY